MGNLHERRESHSDFFSAQGQPYPVSDMPCARVNLSRCKSLTSIYVQHVMYNIVYRVSNIQFRSSNFLDGLKPCNHHFIVRLLFPTSTVDVPIGCRFFWFWDDAQGVEHRDSKGSHIVFRAEFISFKVLKRRIPSGSTRYAVSHNLTSKPKIQNRRTAAWGIGDVARLYIVV